MPVTTIGLDIAKSVFQVHGVDAAGQVVIRRQLKRRAVLVFFQKLPPCLIGAIMSPGGGARGQMQELATGKFHRGPLQSKSCRLPSPNYEGPVGPCERGRGRNLPVMSR